MKRAYKLYTTFLPSIDKEVTMVVFNMGNICDYINLNTVKSKIDYLEGHINTTGLNCLEKFIALIELRSACIAHTFAVSSKDRDVNVSVGVFEEGLFHEDIKETTCIDNITITFDYPTSLYNNSKYSVISKIEIVDKEYTLEDLTNDERERILELLPFNVIEAVDDFIKRKAEFLQFTFLEESNLPTIHLDLLSENLGATVASLFDVLDMPSYRELIFILSERIRDVKFLQDSTYRDLQDYMDLYKREVDRRNEELKKQSSKYK